MRTRLLPALAVVMIGSLSGCRMVLQKTHFGFGGKQTRVTTPQVQRQMPRRAEGTTLRVASFNILYAGKREFPWANRRDAVVECVRDMDPDIFGVQEALWQQVEYLINELPAYACIGCGRDDGWRGGEIMGLFVRRDRFAVRHGETFWLSDTPDVAGSNTWGAACNRTATVAVLIDRTDGTSLGVCNTHFDHVSAQARENSAALIQSRLPRHGRGLPWIVTGDFNSTPGSKPHVTLVGPGAAIPLYDTFARVHPNAPAETSSFHGYAAEPRGGSRIDWILATPQFETLASGICQFKYRAVYPSDHFPVWTDLRRDQ